MREDKLGMVMADCDHLLKLKERGRGGRGGERERERERERKFSHKLDPFIRQLYSLPYQ